MERNWDEDSELWEHQGNHLTVGALRSSLHGLDDDLPVRVLLYRPSGQHDGLAAMELGLTGSGSQPEALVVTVTEP